MFNFAPAMKSGTSLLVTFVLMGVVAVQGFAPVSPRLFPIQHDFLAKLFASEQDDASEIKPDILQPFPPAADPLYYVRGNVGKNDFVVARSGSPTAEELSNENLLRILKIECSDLEVCI